MNELKVFNITIKNPWTHVDHTFEAVFEDGYWWAIDEGGYGERKLIYIEPPSKRPVRKMSRPETTEEQEERVKWQRIQQRAIESLYKGLDHYKWTVALDLSPDDGAAAQYFRCDLCGSRFFGGGDLSVQVSLGVPATLMSIN